MDHTIFQMPLLNGYQSHIPVGFYDAKRGHTGEDYGFSKGTTLLAPLTGTVIALLKQVEMGNCLYFRHDASGHIWVFAHNDQFLKKVGDKVQRLDPLVVTGDTGTKVKGAHSHIEVITPAPLNPEDHVMLRPELKTAFNGKGYNSRPSALLKYFYHLNGLNPLTLKDLVPNDL